MRSLSPSTRVCTERMSVNGGRTATSTRSKSSSVNEKASFCTTAMASRWLRFIFQLPAINGRRVLFDTAVLLRRDARAAGPHVACGSARRVLQRRQPRQGLALEKLERCSPAGGDVGERRLVESELAHRRGGVAP